ncbi:MAG: DUF2834 domain-containing protein [Paracoccaceae bacterium]|nr:DUF2834 domain-containing protein [Paracoccaceae bacterium]
MRELRWVFLALALLGALHPMYYFVQWFMANGWEFGLMMDAWHVNTASSRLVWDSMISALVLTIWIVSEVLQHWWWCDLIAVLAIFCIGVSCVLPLYLYLRSGPSGASSHAG